MSVTIDRPTTPTPTWQLAAASVLPTGARQRAIDWLRLHELIAPK